MRVATTSLYNQSKENISRKNRNVLDQNSLISSGKRIRKLSDDPVDASRVAALKTNMSDLFQLQRNVATGSLWLEGSEESMERVKDMVARAKELSIAMANGIANSDDFQTAALEVGGLIKGVLDQANTRMDGQYIFSGSRSDIRPFQADNEDLPSSIAYEGNSTPFRVKIGPQSDMIVGFAGKEIFSSNTALIDETNNYLDFTEKRAGALPGEETVLTARVDGGTYSRQELAHAVEMSMERASADKGEGTDYRVSWNEAQETFTIAEEDGLAPAKLDRISVLFRTGENRHKSVGAFMGFSTDDATTEASREPLVSRRGVQWGIFTSLFELKAALESNDKEGLHQSISRLGVDHNKLLSSISEAGVRANRLDTRDDLLKDLALSHDANRSKLEDTDVVRAISDLRLKQFGYESALASTSRLLNTSLLNYLK
ncbi:flagellar hook-associated protein FlgL [Desulfoluna sp.]|uniref:flagellar hook-associated protein FlgL n=1 Tax=Desulfoluna sp. TaxID=2045199 RepID=UPI002626A8CE|nr:flagellar hook-associated protein FlgL [Desulfoluna sp.]